MPITFQSLTGLPGMSVLVSGEEYLTKSYSEFARHLNDAIWIIVYEEEESLPNKEWFYVPVNWGGHYDASDQSKRVIQYFESNFHNDQAQAVVFPFFLVSSFASEGSVPEGGWVCGFKSSTDAITFKLTIGN